MRFRRPYEAREPEDCSAADLGLYVKLSTSYSAIPPPQFGACEDTTRVILRELGDNFRPIWATSAYRSPNGGTVVTHLHVLGSYVPVTKNRDPRKSGQLIKGLLLPTVGSLGIDWKAPIYADDVLDGLSDDERLAGALPRYEPLDWEVVAALRRGLWRKRNAERLSRAQEARNEKAAQKAEDESGHRSMVESLMYQKHNDRLNTVPVEGYGNVPPEQPTVFLNGAA